MTSRKLLVVCWALTMATGLILGLALIDKALITENREFLLTVILALLSVAGLHNVVQGGIDRNGGSE